MDIGCLYLFIIQVAQKAISIIFFSVELFFLTTIYLRVAEIISGLNSL